MKNDAFQPVVLCAYRLAGLPPGRRAGARPMSVPMQYGFVDWVSREDYKVAFLERMDAEWRQRCEEASIIWFPVITRTIWSMAEAVWNLIAAEDALASAMRAGNLRKNGGRQSLAVTSL